MFDRPTYVDAIMKFADAPLIKVLTGIRRCGKSTILLMLIEALNTVDVVRQGPITLNDPMKDIKELLLGGKVVSNSDPSWPGTRTTCASPASAATRTRKTGCPPSATSSARSTASWPGWTPTASAWTSSRRAWWSRRRESGWSIWAGKGMRGYRKKRQRWRFYGA